MKTQTKAYEYFGTITRLSGDIIYCLKDDAPPVMREFLWDIHRLHFGQCPPNDWIYETVFHAFCDLYESDNNIEHTTIEADVYNHDLIEWLKEPYALEYCERWAEEAEDNARDIIKQISSGQWLAKDMIYREVHEFINKNAEQYNQ